MKQLYTKEQIIKMLTENLTQEDCQSIIDFCSTRPAPMSSEGQAWEQGALWGWSRCLNYAKYVMQEDKN